MARCKRMKMFRFLVPLLVIGMVAAARRHHQCPDEVSSERRFGRHFEHHFMHKRPSMVV